MPSHGFPSTKQVGISIICMYLLIARARVRSGACLALVWSGLWSLVPVLLLSVFCTHKHKSELICLQAKANNSIEIHSEGKGDFV
jgi:hypothetical protein